MNMKRLALIGVLALVVIGCVVAAGCTSQVNTDPNQVNPASGSIVDRINDTGAQKIYEENYSNLTSYLTLDKNGGDTDGYGEINPPERECHTFIPATRDGYVCTGYYESPTDGERVINADGTVDKSSLFSDISNNMIVNRGYWLTPYNIGEGYIHPYYYTLYAYWEKE